MFIEFSPGTPDPGSRGIFYTPTSAYHITQITEFGNTLQSAAPISTHQHLQSIHLLYAAGLALAYCAAVVAFFFQSSLDTSSLLVNPFFTSCASYGISSNSILAYSTRIFTT